MNKITVAISCEHAVNTVPINYQHFFADHQELLNSHEGYDPGALSIANYLSQSLNTSLTSSWVTRLLIDCNRSLAEPDCFSHISSSFSTEEKNRLIRNFYTPYRQHIEHNVKTAIESGHQVWHISIHSFTPEFKGETREADIGLLFDPDRKPELELAEKWQILLKDHTDFNDIRFNYPYQGISDGVTRSLRHKFSEHDYLGIEIECNQRITRDPSSLSKLTHGLDLTLKILQDQAG